MHRAVVAVVIAACGTPAPTPVRTAALPLENHTHTCAEAAVGLERGTVDVRPPDTSIVQDMRARCTTDAWSVAVIDCFAVMKPGGLGRCAGKLPDALRDAMFATLGGVGDDRTEVALAEARLSTLQLNIAECDRFIGVVRSLIACESMPLTARATLGREVSDVWSLPTHDLPVDAAQRIAETCSSSRASLEVLAAASGCL